MFDATNKKARACDACQTRTRSTDLDAGGHCEACATDLDDVDRARALIRRCVARAIEYVRAAREAGGDVRAHLLTAATHYRGAASRERRFLRLSLESIADRRAENAVDGDVFAPLRAVAVAS